MDKPTILVVEDDETLLKTMFFMLKEEFNVLTALNGKEGLSVYKSTPLISVILLDLDMPVMNGVEMLKRVSEMDGDIKAIVMTGKSTHEWAMQCADLAVHGYIEKPFKPKDIIEKIKSLFQGQTWDKGSSSSLYSSYSSLYH